MSSAMLYLPKDSSKYKTKQKKITELEEKKNHPFRNRLLNAFPELVSAFNL